MIDHIVDLHVHSAPSLVPRHATDPQTASRLHQLGVSMFVLKAHEGSTAERASLLGEGTVGGVVLNSPVGGANPDAVTVAARLGARIVWLPTISSTAHRRSAASAELAAHAGVSFREVSVVEQDEVRPEWLEVLDVVADHDLVLASGHLTMDETVIVFERAREAGVRRFLVNHPMLGFLGWRDEHAAALKELDARLEVGVLADHLDAAEELTPTVRLAGLYPSSLLVFGSDLGHADYPSFEDGIVTWVEANAPLVGEDALASVLTVNGLELISP